MNKEETIRNIKDVNSLTAVISNLAEKSNLSDISVINNVVSAIEKAPFKNKKIAFVCTLSELNGKVPQILEIVKNITSSYDEIFIVTSHKKKISEYFQKWIIAETKNNKYQFWHENDLIDLIEKLLPEYWGHNDLFLKAYEDSFIGDIQQEIELKKILKLDKKFEDLLNVFVEPKIYYFREDIETQRKVKIKVSIDFFLKQDNFFISGDAGTGKSTLLKEIGKKILIKNKETQSKCIPILIKTTNISTNSFSITKAMEKILVEDFAVTDLEKIFEDYHIILLIDSIDEFDRDIQKNIFSELEELVSKHTLNFILSTRNYENITKDKEVCKHISTYLSNFDQRQVKQYLDNFFKFDLAKSDKLWESLLDNHILERIPTTPLTISLVSILYEENGYEVPATLTDVYDNFNIFLLGRLNVKDNLDFLEINVKEKILSMYALEIIKTPNRIRKNKDAFKNYLLDYFSNKSITIDEDLVPELINSMTEGTGVLYINDSDLVTFKHDHFMEYYASKEIFNQHNRTELEKELIQNFTKYNWQNTAIFYAGRTKDMPEFLTSLIKRVYEYNQLNHCLLAISGLGYILQSLWMTDSKVRKEGVVAALELLIKADTKVKLLAESKFHFFQGVRDVDIALMNLVWFYNHFNSIALRDPLKLAFDDLHLKLDSLKDTAFENDKTTREYQLFCVASTLNTGRNEDSSKLDLLFERDKILSKPLFTFLFDNAIRILEFSNEKKLREDFKLKNRVKKYISTIRFYLDTPAEDLRFTTYEVLNPIKNVEIYTEGKSDAKIIDHAFRVLTKNKEPHWNITSMDNVTSKGGGADELSKHLKALAVKISSEIDKKKTVIGVFDNDEKGFREFNSLGDNFELINGIVKKDKTKNIYAILLPIPDGDKFKPYIQEKQVFKFYSIEHYFEKEYLESYKMIKETSINGVFEIVGDKNKFSESIVENTNVGDFKNFIFLFNELDSICKVNHEYIH